MLFKFIAIFGWLYAVNAFSWLQGTNVESSNFQLNKTNVTLTSSTSMLGGCLTPGETIVCVVIFIVLVIVALILLFVHCKRSNLSSPNQMNFQANFYATSKDEDCIDDTLQAIKLDPTTMLKLRRIQNMKKNMKRVEEDEDCSYVNMDSQQ